MISDFVLIIIASIGSTLFAEGLSWLFVYRTESYKRMKATIDRLQSKVDKNKKPESSTPADTSTATTTTTTTKSTVTEKKGSKEKKVTRYEDQLKEVNREIGMAKMKSTFAVGFAMVSLFGFLNNYFDGIIVARLPFEPIGFLRGVSHRNLPGLDYYECSMLFIYILCSFGIRPNIQRYLGTQAPKNQPSFFGPS